MTLPYSQNVGNTAFLFYGKEKHPKFFITFSKKMMRHLILFPIFA